MLSHHLGDSSFMARFQRFRSIPRFLLEKDAPQTAKGPGRVSPALRRFILVFGSPV